MTVTLGLNIKKMLPLHRAKYTLAHFFKFFTYDKSSFTINFIDI